MDSVPKFCFLWPIMFFAAIVSMEYEASVLFESTQIKAIKKRRQIIEDELQKNPAVLKTQIKNYSCYGCLGTLACAGAVIFAQNMSIDATRINLFESCMGGITVLVSTAIIDVLHRRFSDNIEALVDYKIRKNSIEKEPKALIMSQAKEDLSTIDANYKEEFTDLIMSRTKEDLSTIDANYDAFYKNYFLPQTRFANWILKKFGFGRTKKHTQLQRYYITDTSFPLYGEKVAQYFGKNSLDEL